MNKSIPTLKLWCMHKYIPAMQIYNTTQHNTRYLTIILQKHTEYRLILSQLGLRPRWLKSDNNYSAGLSRILVLLVNNSTKSILQLEILWLCSALWYFGQILATYVYRRISVMYGWRITVTFWPYMGIVQICWIIKFNTNNTVQYKYTKQFDSVQ